METPSVVCSCRPQEVSVAAAVSVRTTSKIRNNTDPGEATLKSDWKHLVTVAGLFVAVAGTLLLGAVLPTARAAQAAGMLIWFVMLFIGGAGPPPEVMTGAMQTILKLNPLWHAVKVMQDAWLGLDAGLSWLIVGAIFAASAALSLRFFRWE